MNSFARATITKYQRLNGLNNRGLFSHSSGAWKPEIKVSAGLFPSETSPWLVDVIFSLGPHRVFPLCDPNLLLWGQQSYWIRAHPNNLFLY